jgi:hypothetical protein
MRRSRAAACSRPRSSLARSRARSDWRARGQVALAGLLSCFLWFLPPGRAAAAPEVHGAIDGRFLLEPAGRLGGALTADLWFGSGLLKAGVAAGVGAISADGKKSSRVFTPVGLSLGLAPKALDASGPLATLRLGVAPGAEKGGFLMAFWADCALGYRFALGEGASLRLGADAWLLIGPRGGLFFGPFVGLGF